MAKILLTGGSGFIGRNIIPLLGDHEVTVVSSNPEFKIGGASEVIHCDLLDHVEVAKMVKTVAADKLIHLAWGMAPSNYNLASNFDWLTTGMHLIDQFRRSGGQSVLVAGSCVQYDWAASQATGGSCHETLTPRSDQNTYAQCKNILEDFVVAYCRAHEMQYTWARPFFMFGPGEDSVRLVAHIITELLAGREATVQNGAVARDFLHTSDVAGMMWELFDQGHSGVFNVGSGQSTNLGDLGRMIAQILGRPELLKVIVPTEATNRDVFANMELLRSTISGQPKFDLRAGLEHTIQWWKQNAN